MSPTILREKGFRFLFFSREEERMHIHVQCEHGEAKFWIEPAVELARNDGLNDSELRFARQTIEDRANEIRTAWREHFGG
jgi:hypothetical protein